MNGYSQSYAKSTMVNSYYLRKGEQNYVFSNNNPRTINNVWDLILVFSHPSFLVGYFFIGSILFALYVNKKNPN